MIAEQGLSRRSFLAVAAAASSLGLAGIWSAQRVSIEGYPASAHDVFSRRVNAVLQRLGQLWLPDGRMGLVAQDELPWLDSLAQAWARMPADLAVQVNQATEAFDVAALVYGWHGRSFVSLPDAQAHAYVQRWADGLAGQRSLIAAYRQLIHVSYWRHAQSWPATGYPGPLHRRVSLPSLGDAPEPQR